MESLLTISPIDGRYENKVSVLNEYVSEFALIKYRIKVEIEWFKTLCNTKQLNLPQLTNPQIKFLNSIHSNFNLDEGKKVKNIEKDTNHDVKAVEYYIKNQIKKNSSLKKYSEYIHFACTSEDINNLSYALMLNDVLKLIIIPILNKITDKISLDAHKYKNIAMISRTHGQAATPTTIGKELYNVYYRLTRQLQQLKTQQILGKINGAVGNYNAHHISYPQVNWLNVSKLLVEKQLGLTLNPFTTQIEPHDYIAEIMDNLRRINTILIDFNRDIWGYISYNYFKQQIVKNEVGSSTMPHKVNPIDFENSEGNLGVANALAMHLAEKLPISRFQRDLTDSTVQRNLGTVFAYSLLAYNSLLKGLGKLQINQIAINTDLEQNWELLSEAIQTVMRKHNVANAYEQLKQLTRGKKLTKQALQQFIKTLDLPLAEKNKLSKLTPADYIGLADKLF
jgi:adenylosuccinate lyase